MQINKVIKKYGYTIDEVSAATDMSSAYIYNFIHSLKNGSGGAAIKTLRKIADAIGCHPAEFFLDEPTTHNGKIISHKITNPVGIDTLISQPIEQPTGLAIRDVLAEKGVTQKELAVALGISEGTLSSSLNQELEMPTSRLLAIANYLDVNITELLGYNDKEDTDTDTDTDTDAE